MDLIVYFGIVILRMLFEVFSLRSSGFAWLHIEVADR